MRGAPVWSLEWTQALRRRRLLALNTGVPVLLVLPIALSSAPPFHAAAVYTVLFVLFGTFGSAIPLLRDGDGGPLRRILLTGVPASGYLGQRILAATVLDFLQLLPAVVLALGLGGAHVSNWIPTAGALLVALLAANLVGAWVAALAGSLAEGALLAAVASLFLLHGSGVFRTPVPGSVGDLLAAALPFGPLHRSLLDGVGVAGSDAGLHDLALPTGLTFLGLAATLLLSGLLLERIAPSGR